MGCLGVFAESYVILVSKSSIPFFLRTNQTLNRNLSTSPPYPPHRQLDRPLPGRRPAHTGTRAKDRFPFTTFLLVRISLFPQSRWHISLVVLRLNSRHSPCMIRKLALAGVTALS